MTAQLRPAASAPRVPQRTYRLWGAAAGIATGLFDTAFMRWLGVSFEVNGRDASLAVGLYFGLTFALLGYLLVVVWEGRKREQAQAAELEGLRARLAQSEKLAVLGQLASAIAHEVRNPLGVIRSAAQGILETLPAEGRDAARGGADDSRRSCTFILAEVDRLTAVITSLLGFVRPTTLHRRPLAAREVLERAALLAQPAAASKKLTLQIEAEPRPLPDVDADPDLATQVILALLHNAVEATPPGGRIRLGAQADGEQVALRVSDSGPGIPADLRDKVFEPFFSTRADGTGLGLAVARQIAEAHGGSLRAGTPAGGGAEFTLRLPVAAAKALAA